MRNHDVEHIVLAGGGTGGHLFPGLAVAEQLENQLPGALITFAGTGKPQERQQVVVAGHDYVAVPCRPVPRQPWQAMRFVSDNLAGYWAARWFLRERHVSLVVGLGGYASATVVRAAVARAVPIVLLEQNAIPGRVTRWLAPAASLVCGAFREMWPHMPVGVRLRITGNPVRKQFHRAWTPCRRRHDSLDSRAANDRLGATDSLLTSLPDDPIGGTGGMSNSALVSAATVHRTSTNNPPRHKQLLVLGGSNGARTLNKYVPRAVKRLAGQLDDWRIIHQTGPGQLQATEAQYRQCGVDAVVVSYIDEMAVALRNTDVAICRAGGTTLAELAVAGVPPVVVPLPDATDDHQSANARALAARDACRVVYQNDGSAPLDEAIARELSMLTADQPLRETTRQQIRTLARPDAARLVAAAVRQLVSDHPQHQAA